MHDSTSQVTWLEAAQTQSAAIPDSSGHASQGLRLVNTQESPIRDSTFTSLCNPFSSSCLCHFNTYFHVPYTRVLSIPFNLSFAMHIFFVNRQDGELPTANRDADISSSTNSLHSAPTKIYCVIGGNQYSPDTTNLKICAKYFFYTNTCLVIK